MTPTFRKLNLKDQAEILVVNAPPSFEPELTQLEDVTIRRDPDQVPGFAFALAFVMDRPGLEAVAPALVGRAQRDAVLWFAYPKLTSRKYKSDLNRDDGWASLSAAGFPPVRSVAIDDDWSAARFRRLEFVKPSRGQA